MHAIEEELDQENLPLHTTQELLRTEENATTCRIIPIQSLITTSCILLHLQSTLTATHKNLGNTRKKLQVVGLSLLQYHEQPLITTFCILLHLQSTSTGPRNICNQEVSKAQDVINTYHRSKGLSNHIKK